MLVSTGLCFKTKHDTTVDSFCSLRGGSIFIRHQDLMHPSSESFSFGTLKDITLFFFFLNSHLQQHNAKTEEQEKNETKKKRLRLCESSKEPRK